MKKNFLARVEDGQKFSGYARVLKTRDFGKISFWKVRFCEEEVQLLIQKNLLDNYDQVRKINLGSLIFLEGEKMVTEKGEPSIAVFLIKVKKEGSEILQKKLSGVNHLSRSGNRVLDIISSKALFDYFILISNLTEAIKRFLGKKRFREFSTGTLQEYFEGGQAEPFKTVCRANGKTFYLSLTSELKLKRLMVAGFEKVYEFSQSFRNEGVDRMHLPEFTLLELYAVNQNYHDMMVLLEDMIASVLAESGISQSYNNASEINLQPPFARKTFNEFCLDFLGIPGCECTVSWLANKYPGVFLPEMNEFTWTMKLVDSIFTPHIVQPTFLTDVPSGISPFAKRHAKNESFSESAFFIATGVNIATISTDENDADVIASLLEKQAEKTGRLINQEYLKILDFGLPQTAGIGFGLNRFFMLFQEGKRSAKETCVLPIF